MAFSRKNPSPEYCRLIEEYRSLHLNGSNNPPIPGEKIFAGFSTFKRAEDIRSCLMKTPCLTLLDYGSGKGLQYNKFFFSDDAPEKLSTLKEYWKLTSITCYDPAYSPYEKLAEGTFDAVICIDVLEHLPEEDLEWILEEIFSKSNKLVYLSVACFSARKTLNTGENAHTILKPPEWWQTIIEKTATAYPKVKWRVVYKR